MEILSGFEMTMNLFSSMKLLFTVDYCLELIPLQLIQLV